MSKIFLGLTLEDWHASHEQPALLYILAGHRIGLSRMVRVKKCGEQISYLGGQVLTQDHGSDKQDLGKSWPLRSRPRDPADWETCFDHLDTICLVGSLQYKLTITRSKTPMTSTSLLSQVSSISTIQKNHRYPHLAQLNRTSSFSPKQKNIITQVFPFLHIWHLPDRPLTGSPSSSWRRASW